jgi:polysaccharide biosynthesis protein PslH
LKILQICSKPPFPPQDGGCVAMNVLTNGLIDVGNEVKVLAINTQKHFVDINDLPSEYITKTQLEFCFVDTNVKATDAFLNLFSSKSYNITRFYSEDFEKKLFSILKKQHFDVIQLETLFVTPYLETIRKYSKAKVVLRAHNAEFTIWEQKAKATSNLLKKAYLSLLAKRLKKYEVGLLNKYDAIATISSSDTQIFKEYACKIPILEVPIGIDLASYKVDNTTVEPNSLFYLGSMDWSPNIEAMDWFVKNVWPLVIQKNQNIQFYLAGRKLPDYFKKLNLPNFNIVGEVSDAITFFNSKSVMVVPIFTGGGVRVKVVEAMALEKPIISTTMGMLGLHFEDKKHVHIADTPQDFANAICCLFENKEYAYTLGKNARNLMEEKYDNRVISEKLSAFYTKLIIS